jgi:enamine deaminase RidA (YjgF/YER057c/UK114 family)
MSQQSELMVTPRRDLLGAALLGAAGGLLVSGPVQGQQAQNDKPQAQHASTSTARRQALRPAGAPAADVGYSPAILAEGQRLIFISGQGPENLKADMETQIRQTFDRIGLLLEAAGATFANVVIIRSYWVHLLRDLPIFRKVRLDYLIEPYPASTAVGTPELAIPGLDLEIEAVAVV